MSRQWVRWVCLIIMLAVAIPSGYRLLHSEQHNDSSQQDAAAFDSRAWMLSLTVAKLQAAQLAYVAGGQDPERWFTTVDRQLEAVVAGMVELTSMAHSTSARDALAMVDTMVERLRGVDGIAREHVVNGETLMASDLVFADGRELARRANAELADARTAEAVAQELREEQHRRDQITTWLVATAASVGIVLLLVPTASRVKLHTPSAIADDGTVDAAAATEPDLPHSLEFDIEPAGPAGNLLLAPGGSEGVPATEPLAQKAAPELSEVAQVCTDLGCISEPSELREALASVAELVNAAGLVVWVRDGSGHALRPGVGHGFAPDALHRLGTLSNEDDNITAAAYRTRAVQVASARGDCLGAIAAPLITSSGQGIDCGGVLAAELRDGWETRPAVQSAMAIVAAQLGTLVTADPMTDAPTTSGRRSGRPRWTSARTTIAVLTARRQVCRK